MSSVDIPCLIRSVALSSASLIRYTCRARVRTDRVIGRDIGTLRITAVDTSKALCLDNMYN
jgi:hypothetical protein